MRRPFIGRLLFLVTSAAVIFIARSHSFRGLLSPSPPPAQADLQRQFAEINVAGTSFVAALESLSKQTATRITFDQSTWSAPDQQAFHEEDGPVQFQLRNVTLEQALVSLLDLQMWSLMYVVDADKIRVVGTRMQQKPELRAYDLNGLIPANDTPRRPPREVIHTSGFCSLTYMVEDRPRSDAVQDIGSAVYLLTQQPYRPGASYPIHISDFGGRLFVAHTSEGHRKAAALIDILHQLRERDVQEKEP